MADHREYYLKRLHSLLGVVPIGVFLLQHLFVNHMIVYGTDSFDKGAAFLHDLPFRIVLEIVIIFLPLLFHAIMGVYIALTAKNNPTKYGFFRNWMFALQRFSGIFTLIFIAWHVFETRVQVGLGNVELGYQMMVDILSNPFLFWFYIVGILSTTFHFANGLWSFLASWGITQSPRSQKVATYFSVIVFLVVSYIGIRAIIEFAYGI